jgi:hypothetical protein
MIFIVFVVLNDVHMLVFLNSLVMILMSFLIYVKVAQFFLFPGGVFCSDLFFFFFFAFLHVYI